MDVSSIVITSTNLTNSTVSLINSEGHVVAKSLIGKSAFCLKKPPRCPSGKVQIGALCYSLCPANYERFNFDCHEKCKPGWRNDGSFCRLAGEFDNYQALGSTHYSNCQSPHLCFLSSLFFIIFVFYQNMNVG